MCTATTYSTEIVQKNDSLLDSHCN